jgi:hypothetical protein
VEKWPSTWPRWATICGVSRKLDGDVLVCLDADTPKAAEIGRSILPHHTRVRTGRDGGEHTWVSIPLKLQAGVLCRCYMAINLDWRGGDCIALLPGSQWKPRSHPEVTYDLLSGPMLPEVLEIPPALAKVVARRAANAGQASIGSAFRSPYSHRSRLPVGTVDLSESGAFEMFLTAVRRSGRTVNLVKGRAGEAFVQCPGAGHPDQNRNRPCLHVTARAGGIGLHCFGSRGCTNAEIVASLELELADLYDNLSGLKIRFVDE